MWFDMENCENCIHEKICVIKAFPDAFENTEWSKKPSKEREFYSYVRKIVESARYTGNADHEDVPSILRDFENKIKTEVAREIFAEISKILTENKVHSDSGIYYEHSVWYDIAKLNDKYTKE